MANRSGLPSVVIAGGVSGHIGKYVTEGFLHPHFRSQFSNIVVFTRNATTNSAKALAARGVKVQEVNYDGDISTSLFDGIDIFVDTLGSGDGGSGFTASEKLIKAAIASGSVKIYVPSDFGFDHQKITFEFPFFEVNQKHARLAKEGGIKPIAILPGYFLEDIFEPYTGFDTASGKWTFYGTPTTRITLTAMADVGRATASATALAFNNPEAVPELVQIGGHSLSIQEAHDICSKYKEITLEPMDVEPFRESVLQKLPSVKLSDDIMTIFDPVKLAIADGSLETTQAENELVNPRESLWKWKTLDEYAAAEWK